MLTSIEREVSCALHMKNAIWVIYKVECSKTFKITFPLGLPTIKTEIETDPVSISEPILLKTANYWGILKVKSQTIDNISEVSLPADFY